ncbi:hypothetical protein F5Y11DRAFT_58617 [Daldinia sp. FL1419]|nr:hypothetical protein F5Y11DRAFT_58617 [Daldinia sp. FL1419]
MAGLSETPQSPRATAPKVRASCDSCGSAKVRCDRSRPKCRRCATLGIKCIYGISRKLGRAPRRGLSTGTDTESTPGASRQVRRLWPSSNIGSIANTALEGPSRVLGGVPSSFPDPRCEMLPAGGSNTETSLTSNFNDGQLELDLFDPLGLEQWPRLDFLDIGIHTTPSPNDSAAEAQVNKTQDTRGSHSCARESYEIFADLICPAPDLHAPNTNSDTVTARLDQVLHFNRKAIDRLSVLLECSCAKSGHRVMVHASIISRILIWYQQAAGWPCSISPEHPSTDTLDTTDAISSSASPSPGPNDETGACSPNLRILPRTTGFIVTDVSATLGTFSIESQKMQATIRNHLVLRELSRMSALIELFSSQLSGEPSVTGAGSLYTYIAAWLRSEYDRTIEDLKAERIALNDTPDT